MSEDVTINIRDIQHYMYCPRRFALLEVNDDWAENAFVVKANLLHENVHSGERNFENKHKIVRSDVSVYNDDPKYNIFGVVDCIEFVRDKCGDYIDTLDGTFRVEIVEYKPTRPKAGEFDQTDAIQVYAQKLCVDNVFHCNSRCFLYYADVRRRSELPFDTQGAEIKKGLLEHEIKEEDIYDYSYFLYTYLPIYFMYVKNKLFFTSENIIPSTVCDLNCRSCLNFNPYIKKHIVDSLEEVKADIDAFFGQVDLIYRLQISGGEPFLYKELGHVLEYIYENYKDKVIRLETVTNGTIVPSDELCRILKKCKVTVFLDDYRKTLPNGEALYERVKNKLNQEEISVIYNYAEKWIRMYSENSSHEEDSEEKLESFYERCGNPWSTLRKKKITGCNYAHYAAKAGILPDDEDNYFVLTGEVDKKALLEFRLRYNEKGYVEFCKKCAGWTSINPNLEDAAIQKAKE